MPLSTQNSQNHPPFSASFFITTTTKLFYVKDSNPFTVNSQNSQTFPSILANSLTMVSNDDVGSQFP